MQQLNGQGESRFSSELYNVLWDILLLEKINHTQLKKIIEKAGGSLRVNIERWWHAEVNKTRQKPWVRISRSLVHMGNMDGLAGLVLIWMHYYQVGNCLAICDIAESIYRSMLVVGISFRTRGLDKEFFDLFKMKVFNLIAWRDSMCLLDYNLFYTSLDIVEYFMRKMKNEEGTGAYLLNKKHPSPRREFFKIVFQFDLPIFPVWGEGPPTKLQWIGYVEKKYHWLKRFIAIKEAYLVGG